MDENKNIEKVVVFKSLDGNLSAFFIMIVFPLISMFILNKKEDYFIFGFGISVLGILFYKLFKNRNAKFKINLNSISICNNGKCKTFPNDKIKNFRIAKSYMHGDSICIEMINGKVISLLFYKFDHVAIHNEIKRQNKIAVINNSSLSSHFKYRLDTYDRILLEKDKTILKLILFLMFGIFCSMYLGTLAHVLFMHNFTHTNYGLGYFIDVWETYIFLSSICSILVFFIFSACIKNKINKMKNELIANYPLKSFKDYKKLRLSRVVVTIFPITFFLILLSIHFTNLIYLTPLPKIQTEFISNDVLKRSWLDMRYICQGCERSISPGHLVYYYDHSNEIRIGVASYEKKHAISLQRNIANVKAVELVVDGTLNKKMIPFNNILGIAKSTKGPIVIQFE